VPGNCLVSAGIGGVGPGFTRPWGYSRTTGYNTTGPESTARAIGLINLQVKLAGKPGTGKPYAGFDVAGVGNVTRGAGLRPTAKALDEPPDPTVGAPIPDPTWEGVGVRFPHATRLDYQHLRPSRRSPGILATIGSARIPGLT
jgi:hypothetical protein